ncbi:unnamed protein product [Amaranthus hypochondriacus]
MDNSKNRQNDYLGVNKIGKNIRKSPLHQPNFVNSNVSVNGNVNNINPARQQPQPQVYNISKSDFRSIVQQLTGSPSRQDPLPRPPNNPPKHPSMRLQRIRPPPLTPINRGPIPPVVAASAPTPMQPPLQGGPAMGPPQVGFNHRPQPPFNQPSPRGMQPFARGDGGWTVPALSPVSAYVQQLQNCLGDGSPRPSQFLQQPRMPEQFQAQPQMHSQGPRHMQGQPQMQPQPHSQPPVHIQAQGQPPMYPPGPEKAHTQPQPQTHPRPPYSGLLPNPNMPPLPSPGTNGPAPLPSPTSQFFLPSPTGFFNVLSPISRSPYPLLSPGSQFPPLLSPNFAFSPFGHSGILGPSHQPPLSPGYAFPLSPSGLFPISSPRWRDPSF